MKSFLFARRTTLNICLLSVMLFSCIKKNKSSSANNSFKDAEGGWIADILVPFSAGEKPQQENKNLTEVSSEMLSSFGVCYYTGTLKENGIPDNSVQLVNSKPLPLLEGLAVAQGFLAPGQPNLEAELLKLLDAVTAKRIVEPESTNGFLSPDASKMNLVGIPPTLMPHILKIAAGFSPKFLQNVAQNSKNSFAKLNFSDFMTALSKLKQMPKFRERLVKVLDGFKAPFAGLRSTRAASTVENAAQGAAQVTTQAAGGVAGMQLAGGKKNVGDLLGSAIQNVLTFTWLFNFAAQTFGGVGEKEIEAAVNFLDVNPEVAAAGAKLATDVAAELTLVLQSQFFELKPGSTVQNLAVKLRDASEVSRLSAQASCADVTDLAAAFNQ